MAFLNSDLTLLVGTSAALAITTVAILREFPNLLHVRRNTRTSRARLDAERGT